MYYIFRKSILLLLLPIALFAVEETFVREYTYKASDYDSKVTARANALEEAKRLLLEEVAVFIKSEFEMERWQETIGDKVEYGETITDKLIAITAGITETKILKEKWTGYEYWLKAEITLDPDDIKKKIDQVIQDKEKLKELEEVKKKADESYIEIQRLREELAKSRSEIEKLRLTRSYYKETNVLSAIDWFEKGHSTYINEDNGVALK